MKITMQIEVSTGEELTAVSAALSGLMSADKVSDVQVSHPVDKSVVVEGEMVGEAPKTPKRTKNSKPKEEKEEMIPVESPFTQTTPPSEPLVSNQHVHQGAPTPNVFPHAVEHIQSEAKRLEGMQFIPADVKRALIESLKQEIGAPQGTPASKLPEPYLSQFAANFSRKIDMTAQQFVTTNAGLV
jgi:hypothetical protein